MPSLPTKKNALIPLAMELIKHATKTERRTWNKTRLGKLSPEALSEKILGWAERAKRGRVTHLSALRGKSTACAAERDKPLTLAQRLTMPIAAEGAEPTCKHCREAAGLLSAEEQAEFDRQELAEIEAEFAAARSGAPTRTRNDAPRTRKAKSKGINEQRFDALATEGRLALTGTFKGSTFQAELNRDGTVIFGGETHKSLSKAACAARQTPTCNGWRFWTLSNGERADWLRGTEAPALASAAA